MKKNTFSVLFIFLLFISSVVDGAEGDYRSYQSGNWNVPGNWQKYVSGNWISAPEAPPITGLSKRVTIVTGHNITATANISGAIGAILEIEDGGTLTMGSYYIRGSVSGKFPTIIINGRLTTSQYVTSNSFTIGSTGHFSTSYSAVGISGWWSGSTFPQTVSLNGEVEFNSTGAQVIPGYDYFNLVASASGIKTVSGNISVSGSFTIESGTPVFFTDCFLVLNGEGAGIINDGSIEFSFSSLYFEDGSQTVSGSGTISGQLDRFSVGENVASTASYSGQGELNVGEMIVYTGSSLILGSETHLTVTSILTTDNNLTLGVSSSAPYTSASFIVAPFASVNGNVKAEIYLTGGGTAFNRKWHYISSPFGTTSATPFSNVTPDLAQFIESRPATSLLQGWVAYDGYIYSTGASNGPTFSTLEAGKGYNFFDYSDHKITFSGILNKSDITANVFHSGAPLTMHGFNVLGNPFSSGLNWDYIINGNYPANASKGIYFTRNNQQCSYINGVGIPEDVTGIIPPMQGFFVKTNEPTSITLSEGARTHSNIHARYKGESIIPLVRLNIFDETESNDETVVRFDEDAKTAFDNDFDAVKMFLSEANTSIYTSMSGTHFAINGLPYPEGTMEIPVVVNVTTSGNHKIVASKLEGLDNFGIILKDKLTSLNTNLKTNPELVFNSTTGTLSDRFVLQIVNNPTGIIESREGETEFRIYFGYDKINIMPVTSDWDGNKGEIKILDLTGKVVADIRDTEFYRNSIIQAEEPSSKGLYIVEIRAGYKRFTGKVVVR